MKIKNLLAFLLTLTFIVIPASAGSHDDLIQPYDMNIASGYMYDVSDYIRTYYLDHRNGFHLFFYVENRGTTEVMASINGLNQVIAPGNSATVRYAVVNPFIEEYEFKIVPTATHGTMSVYYSIIQREEAPVG